MIITTKGIILRERPVRENDKYVQILCEDVGIIEALVRGGRKITSKNCAATQLLTYSTICLNKTNSGYVVNSSQVINTFYNIRLDVKKLALAAYFSDILRFTTPPEEPAKEVLRLFLNTLHFLDKGDRDNEQMKIVFELRMMCKIGLMPDLIGCHNCYKHEDDEMYFNLYDGRLCCKNCVNEYELQRSRVIDKTMLHTIRYICLSDFEKIFYFKISENCQKKLSPITEQYMKFQFNKAFNTLDYYKKI
ncbi:MAG: DNA repair protein RecO [Oscillospiraceae bacterium]|nr:DNA repair protein RecO [Oscillospiraceae bacterium]